MNDFFGAKWMTFLRASRPKGVIEKTSNAHFLKKTKNAQL